MQNDNYTPRVVITTSHGYTPARAHAIPWEARETCTFGLDQRYAEQVVDATMTPGRQLTNELWDDADCWNNKRCQRAARSWKHNRATQWRNPEPSVKTIMHELVACADTE